MRFNLKKFVAIFLFFFFLPFIASFSAAHAKKSDKKSRVLISEEGVKLGFIPSFSKIDPITGKYYQDIDGYRIYYTIDPVIQSEVKKTLEEFNVSYGAFVAIEPETGKVIAYADYSASEPEKEGRLLLSGTFPAASIFKLITASAAVDLENIKSGTVIPYRGGSYSLTPSNWKANPKKDRNSMTVENAMGKSINVVFARVAEKYVGNENLKLYAEKFGFNKNVPFELPLPESHANIDNEFKTLVRTAAGFGDVTLNPVFAAMIGASFANDGIMMSPYLIDKVIDGNGRIIYSAQPKVYKIPVRLETAEEVRKMMGKTVENGTCRRTFYTTSGTPDIPDVALYGKTGSLSGNNPKGDYSWFVGSGEKKGKNLAVASVVINTGKAWKAKSAYVAKRAFVNYFSESDALYVDNGPPKYKTKKYAKLKKKGKTKGKAFKVASVKKGKKSTKASLKKRMVKKGSSKQYSKLSRTKHKTSL